MEKKLVRWVCDMCGFKTHVFDDNDIKEYVKAKEVMAKHFEERHPKSPRFHNITHYEFVE